MSTNTYVLALRCMDKFELSVGSLGLIEFEEGWYGYLGSARSENFARLKRHRDVSKGYNNVRHWHIDYINGNIRMKLYGAFKSTEIMECELAQSIDMKEVSNFGCSDCICRSHLFYEEELYKFSKIIRDSIESISSDYEWVRKERFDEL